MKEKIIAYITNLIAQEEAPDNEFIINRKFFKNTIDDFPQTVQEAYQYYIYNVEDGDWGTTDLFIIPMEDIEFYAIYTTTDGDDGWVELYDEEGVNIAYGRFYINKILFGGLELREQAEKGGMPDALKI